jgi:hypothetical protein
MKADDLQRRRDNRFAIALGAQPLLSAFIS